MPATLLSYQFQPSQVFIATTTNLQLIITNPVGGQAVNFTGGPQGDEIDIYFPVGSGNTDLVNSITFGSSSQTAGFTCSQVQGDVYFAIRAPQNTTLQPGQTIVITFTNVVINGQTGNPPSAATINISEFIGSSDGTGTTSITKLTQALNVIAWLDPLVVGKRQYATLYWQSMGGTKVVVAGFGNGTGSKDFPVQGDPPYPGNCQVNVPSDTDPQRTYTIRVYTSDNQHTETQVTLTQMPPLITSFNSDIPQGTISVAQPVQLSWTDLYATTTYLQLANGDTLTNPISPLTVNPGQEIASLYQPGSGTQLPGSAQYILTLMGFQKQASQQMTWQLQPVGLAYFKFGTMDNGGNLSGVMFRTDPEEWAPVSADLSNPNLNIFTIHQPGQPNSVYYLGSGDTTHPQIQYFNAEKKTAGQYELKWVTANLTSLVLNPGNTIIPAGQIVRGTMTIDNITAPVLYTFTGTAASGETIVSQLLVGVPPAEEMQKSALAEQAPAPALLNDPNCTVVINQGGVIPNYYGAPSPRQRQDATDAIAQLNFADIWRLPPWRINQGTVRLDIQGVIAGGGRNLQVQINGVAGRSTIAAITVQGNLATASTAARQAYVQRIVRSALVQSLNSANMQDVNGPCN